MVARSLAALLTAIIVTPGLSIADSERVLQLDLQGVIEPSCEINSVSSVALDFSTESTGEINFNVSCNVEMSIGLSSQNGALLNEEAATRNGFDESFARTYSATLKLAAFDFTRTTDSEALQDGVSYDVTEGIVHDTTGSVHIELDSPLAGGFAGTYTDQIRITVAPSLSVASN